MSTLSRGRLSGSVNFLVLFCCIVCVKSHETRGSFQETSCRGHLPEIPKWKFQRRQKKLGTTMLLIIAPSAIKQTQWGSVKLST